MPIGIESILTEYYIGFKLHSNLINNKIDTYFNDIIGGIGLSMLKRNKNEYSPLRNCILLRTDEKDLQECLKNSFVIIYKLNNKDKKRDNNINESFVFVNSFFSIVSKKKNK